MADSEEEISREPKTRPEVASPQVPSASGSLSTPTAPKPQDPIEHVSGVEQKMPLYDSPASGHDAQAKADRAGETPRSPDATASLPPRVIAPPPVMSQHSSTQSSSSNDAGSICPFQDDDRQDEPPEYQEEYDDLGSDLGDERASLTETINSQNYQYRYENGRRYHGFDNAAYLLPNDEREQDRLEGQHQMWVMALGGKLHLAPLKQNIGNVLDVASGTGNWAMDFADEYPSAKVVGTDLSPIQPNFRSVPPNCSFIVEDSEGEWIWEERFDFIHSRTLGSTWRDWPGYFQKCYDFLNPGGYLELHEFTFPFHCDDGTATAENPMMQWSIYFNEAAAKGGVDMEQCARLDPLLREAGFVEVTKRRLRLPFTGWSEDPNEKEYGAFYGKAFDWGVCVALLTRRLGWSRERAEVFLMEARKDAADVGVHAYIPLYIYTARKPVSA
ncbi:S-adenosyl-L-methionine-dependent methyltransferase [Mytilinidion resinicola]|uniref:S-adenosyl-L-methionine-dependent methyltransferase n=1 Tax=Mytilinidion resinicola TaxID=574789 RepID=A0A6A6Y4M6_9PEZI|nr:S-adenosyl-L-methionine-dependent methyltransferase [Mytilinidion resinicola]KAF2802747.1 S-adenosyl-L-methionine-dependent methyltransferase [Mytilinidion resinicola]